MAGFAERQKTLEGLKEFKDSFKLESEGGGEEAGEAAELQREKNELLTFHKAFKLQLDKSQNGKRNDCQSLKVMARGSRRRKRRPEHPKTFPDVYNLTDELLGKGAYSSVSCCHKKSTGQALAVKVVPKSSERVRERVLREVEILYLSRSHKSIVHLLDFFEEDKQFYMVFDMMRGGPLLAHIQKRPGFTEREASSVVSEVASALAFLHDCGVAHRDLKPDNVLCERTSQIVPVRICDFDLSSMVPSQQAASTPMLLTPVGSAEYMAPEVVDTFLGDAFSYDKKCDLWSLGVMLYMMLSGRPPFYGKCGRDCGWERGENCAQCQEMLLAAVQTGDYSFPQVDWLGVSAEAKDLVAKLLKRSAKERLSAHAILQHPWIQQDAPETPLATPGVLNRLPSIPADLSNIVASCLVLTRQLSSQALDHSSSPPSSLHTVTLSPPGSSELALRRKT